MPIFPLPGVFLFPHQVLPLHVFEPRYRQLVDDLLDGPGRFVIGTLPSAPPRLVAPNLLAPKHVAATGREQLLPAGPAVLPVAGLGEIVRHEKLPDGRYHIWVLGLARARLVEVPSTRLYRQVRCEPFVEVEASDAEAAELARQLHAATAARLHQALPIGPTTPPGVLADLLVQTLRPPLAVLEAFYAEPSVSARARLVLAAAASATGESGDQDAGG